MSEFLAGFDLTSWGAWKRAGALIPAIGNHEINSGNGGAGWCEYFFGTTTCAKQFSVDLGTWTVVAADSNGPTSTAEVTEIGGWLDEANAEGDNTIVFGHHPRWSGTGTGLHGPDAGEQPLWDLMIAKKVDINLVGHEHNIQVFHRMTRQRPRSPRPARSASTSSLSAPAAWAATRRRRLLLPEQNSPRATSTRCST